MIHQFQLHGYNIVLDVCSGAVHVVDEVAYDIIAMYENTDHDTIVKEIMAKYGHCMKMVERIPDALAGAMGNQMYMANFDTVEELNAFYADIIRCW